MGFLRTCRALAFAGALGALATAASAGPSARTAATQLSRRILGSDSATAVLQQICSTRGPELVRARQTDNRAERSPPPWVRAALRRAHDERIQYRRVRLVCGDDVLSVADNWYLPAHLTPAMNEALLRTQTPFGVVARPLGFHRRTLVAAPVAPRARRSENPTLVLRHRAVLIDPRGRPFSVVEESYTTSALPR